MTDLTLRWCASRFWMRVSRRCDSEREDRGIWVSLDRVITAAAVRGVAERRTRERAGAQRAAL